MTDIKERCLRACADAAVMAAAEVHKARVVLAWAEAAEKGSLLLEANALVTLSSASPNEVDLRQRCLRAFSDAVAAAAVEVRKARAVLAWAEAAERGSLLLKEVM
jgi:hypothetical protein